MSDDTARTFYRTDKFTGETTERTVVTPSDEVRAKFDGYRAEKKPSAGGKKSGAAADKAEAETPAPAAAANGESAK
jgi:hypothetical protein